MHASARSVEKSFDRNSDVMSEREKYLTMPLGIKRTVYKCGDDYVTLDDIDSWPACLANLRNSSHSRGKQHLPGAVGSSDQYQLDADINQRVSLWSGDITCLEIDCIVNAANSSLLGGGGVDGAIHRGAGQSLLRECRTLGGCHVGDAKVTGGYKLPAKYVIHTVGPKGEKSSALRSCYQRCLDEMFVLRQKSVAFPCISTGIYGYPNEAAVHVALRTVREHLEDLKGQNKLDVVDRVIFCLFMDVDIKLYCDWMFHYFPVSSSSTGNITSAAGTVDAARYSSPSDHSSDSVSETDSLAGAMDRVSLSAGRAKESNLGSSVASGRNRQDLPHSMPTTHQHGRLNTVTKKEPVKNVSSGSQAARRRHSDNASTEKVSQSGDILVCEKDKVLCDRLEDLLREHP